MRRPRVLMLTSFSASPLRSGRQRRAQAIFDLYSQHFDVKKVSVYSRLANKGMFRGDIAVSYSTDRLIAKHPWREELIRGEAVRTDMAVREKIKTLLARWRPDVIQAGGISMLASAVELADELSLTPKFVYGTSSIEPRRYRQIEYSYTRDEESADQLEMTLAEEEKGLFGRTDAVATLSPQHKDHYQTLGASKVVYAPNGGSLQGRISSSSQKYWSEVLQEQLVDKALIAPGGKDPGNWENLIDTIGDRLGYIPPNKKILLAGGIAEYGQHVLEQPRSLGEATFWCRVEPYPKLPQEQYLALMKLAAGVLLVPGSTDGSSTTTAEALLSGLPVLAMAEAFNTFEDYQELPGVSLAASPEDFRVAISSFMEIGPVKLNQFQREGLAWSFRLRPLVSLIKELA